MTVESTDTESRLREIREGKPKAMAALFDEYRKRLRQFVQMRMDPRLATRLDASDVVQEVYLDANRQVLTYLREPKVSFYVWLRGLALQRLSNLRRDHVGAQRRSVQREIFLPLESSNRLARQLLAQGPSPSHDVLKSELRGRVQHALGQLRPQDREVIMMVHFEDMSSAEVAQVLGIGRTAATMRYARALLRLKEILTLALSSGESKP